MKFTFIHIISVIQEMFFVFYNLLRGPDITRSGAGSGPRVVHPWCIGNIYTGLLWVVEIFNSLHFIVKLQKLD